MSTAPKRVLMVAFHFPPQSGSSGVQRSLRFVQQLPSFGWEPIVLSIWPGAYETTSEDLLGEVPVSTVVHRAMALDASRHLAIRRRYLAALARPDRWASWRWDGVRAGLKLIREWRPQLIWSTYPIATAHLIAAKLQAHSGLPWVADFRDPMAQDGYPSDPIAHRQFQAIETLAAQQASQCLFTTPGAASEYRRRYPAAAARMGVLENGYDEASFAAIEAALDSSRPRLNPDRVTLLHSGLVYPSERDPTALFKALALLTERSPGLSHRLRIRFRASGHDAMLTALATQLGVTEMIELVAPLPYKDALTEMLCADALLVMQAANCNQQIPAKVYEYLRARRPVVCLADPGGDTATMLRSAGVTAVAALDDPTQIVELLHTLLIQSQSPDGIVNAIASEAVAAAARTARTAALAEHFDRLTR
ncbi:glycosyltransferase [Roseateles toxinivorans]|uniref:Glycosyl transferase family 4 n=1 Tax=Roseateles toxinivorans TaxID=270368 RepID=A0A4R6QU20_9BURK|nr:glycosyltransferase [Roseateles toxinivorans]TDP74623.1 glycosyl transferase family 4 [Roseateles toxinivorans]